MVRNAGWIIMVQRPIKIRFLGVGCGTEWLEEGWRSGSSSRSFPDLETLREFKLVA